MPNLVRFIFFDPHADDVFPEWNTAADDAVALLLVEAAHSPHSAVVTGLVFDITGADGLSLVGYTAEPQSTAEQALRLPAIVTAADTPSTATE